MYSDKGCQDKRASQRVEEPNYGANAAMQGIEHAAKDEVGLSGVEQAIQQLHLATGEIEQRIDSIYTMFHMSPVFDAPQPEGQARLTRAIEHRVHNMVEGLNGLGHRLAAIQSALATFPSRIA